ncbi:hypothetical protein [Ruminococcus sp.]|uniref:hypothetical protein n=1 Tax=Ruminococcus sp. TaxID=41978 RepID=UPI00399F1EAF
MKLTNGEWSRAMQEIDIDTLERLLNRAKIKNRSTITDEQFEMLSNMILRKKQQTVLSNITVKRSIMKFSYYYLPNSLVEKKMRHQTLLCAAF